MKRTMAAAYASILAAGAALAPAGASAQQGQQLFYPPPGTTGPGWGAPGYWWQGPNRFEQAEVRPLAELFEEQYRRGYARGRYEERMAQQGRGQAVPSVNWLVNPEYAASAQVSPRLPDAATLLQVREALRQGDVQRADQMLAQTEQTLREQERQQAQQAQLTDQGAQGQQAQQPTGSARVTVEQGEQYGPYLTDAGGRALYLFTADQQGTGGTQAQSDCYDACAEAWPPLLTEGEPQAGEQADASLLGTIQRRDGATQVTYNGWPLYYYVQDQGPGEATGQDVHGFGGEWYLLTPQGEKVGEHG